MMKWNRVWDSLPSEDGIYLCALEDHWGIFTFREGKFQPNDFCDYGGVNLESAFYGSHTCINSWMNLPEFSELSLDEIKKYQAWSKEIKKREKSKK